MPKIVQYNLPPGGTVTQVADAVDPALLLEDTAGLDFLEIDTANEKLILAGGGAKTGIGGTPDLCMAGGLHIIEGSSALSAASGNGDLLVLESDQHSGMTFTVPADKSSYIFFADNSTNGVCWIAADQSADSLTLKSTGPWRVQTGGENTRLYIDADGKICTGGEETSLGREGGSLHIMTGNSGGTSEVGYDDLVIERTAGAGMVLLSDATNSQTNGIAFRRGSANSHILGSYQDASGDVQLLFRCMSNDGNNADHKFIFRPNNDATVLTMTGAESTFQDHDVVLQANSADEFADSLIFHKSRHATDGEHTVVNDNDVLGTIEWKGSDGAEFESGAKIFARVNGTPADDASDMPTEIIFATSRDGQSAPTESVAITSSGYLGVGTMAPNSKFEVTTAITESAFKAAQTADNRNTVCVVAGQSIDRGPAFFVSTNENFADGGSYGVVRIDTKAAADTGFALISASSDDGGDLKFKVQGDGAVSADAAYSGSGADYSEFFETTDGNALAAGLSVVLEGGKVRIAQAGEKPIGVVRPTGTSSVVGNDPWNHWKGRYLRDDFGAYVKESYTVTEWTTEDGANHTYKTDKIPEDVVPPDDATISSTDKHGNPKMRKVVNPDYDESLEYVKREDRDEWVIVGLLGQVPVLKDQVMGESWVKMRDVSDSVEFYFIK